MEYLVAWNVFNTIGLIWVWYGLRKEGQERYANSIVLEKMIKKSSPKLRR